MDWLLGTPQLQSTFSSLGSLEGNTYVVSPNALAILKEINYKLTYEDQTLRSFRRAIGFGENIRSDLIPLLTNAKDDAVLESVIRILVNLTVPVECLFSVDLMYRTEVGRHTIFELNKLLYSSKEAFTDPKSTKSVVEYMKNILESETTLSPHKCDQINNCLLLLRNILHIPEHNPDFLMPTPPSNGRYKVSMQNTIMWNLFIQSIDKLLLYLMASPQRTVWDVTMVQLIALFYKDQHVSILQKLLNMWFEASLSESSDDESNTTPPKQASGDSSPMLTSDPTSDSSDNGSNGELKGSDERRQAQRDTEATLQAVSRKGHAYQNAMARVAAYNEIDLPCSSNARRQHVSADESMDYTEYEAPDQESQQELAAVNTEPINLTQPADNVKRTTNTTSSSSHCTTVGVCFEPFKPPAPLTDMRFESYSSHTQVSAVKLGQKSPHSGQLQLIIGKCCPQKRQCPSSQSELSDCGYATQAEQQECKSTSSNEDDAPQGKPQHQKPPCNTKPRNKQRVLVTPIDKKDLRRKKLVKRSKSSHINMKGLVLHTPSDDDISNLLKEFTVDFLLKGYNYLAGEMYIQLLGNTKVPIDTSHFFWLITFFLKFAAQLELDIDHIDSILTFDVLGYLTYEAVSLSEQLELNARQEGNDLNQYLRRMHLVVTAIREFLQAIETYKKVTHLREEDRLRLHQLQLQISSTADLRCLFVLLLRRFNPSIHSKQYLQDLIVTNHILLTILDSASKLEGGHEIGLHEHILQFATLEVMYYYGILLEDFTSNGEFVNDCIFTMMHHIGGDLSQIGVLFQPIILKTYSRIWEAEYDLCDDWSDLIEFVIHKFMNTPPKSPLAIPTTSLTEMTKEHNQEHTICTWTKDEMDTLYWNYLQSKKNSDVIGKIVKLFSNNGRQIKTRISIIQQLLQQDIITLLEYDDLMKFEDAEYQRSLLTTTTSVTSESGIELKDSGYGKPSDDVQILVDLIVKEHKSQHLVWLQKLLLECCYIKLMLKCGSSVSTAEPIMEPVAYHCISRQKPIPVVQWNNEQSTTMLYQPFVLLLHKLGIQLPADAGAIFARIPEYWTPELMYGLAKQLGSLDKLKLKFDPSELDDAVSARYQNTGARNSLSSISSLEADLVDLEELALIPEVDSAVEKAAAAETFVVPRVKHSHSMIRYTPDPTPAMPNWLQLVMRRKCNQRVSQPATDASDCVSTCTMTAEDEGMGKSYASTNQAPSASNTLATMNKMSSYMSPMNENSSSSGCGGTVSSMSLGSLMRSSSAADANGDVVMKAPFERMEVAGAHFARANLHQEYSAMVASVYGNDIANSDNVSVASDLTRMYVSDEDEKHEFRAPVPHYH